MSLQNTHPEYDVAQDDWRQMRDTEAGQRIVKQAGILYLPPTKGQVLDGAISGQEPGYSTYVNYLSRAVFPELVSDAKQILVGIMHREPADIQLPAVMEPLRENATRKGETLEMLLRRINENQLLYGRIGLLADIADGAALPHIVTYKADSITNWDDERATETAVDTINFVVTTEDAWVRGTEGVAIYEWTVKQRYRAFQIGEDGFYETFVEQDDQITEAVTPVYNGQPLDFIPFTFIGSNDLDASPGYIPLLSLSNSALSIYRSEADYRQSLHLLGQDTLVITGSLLEQDDNPDAPVRIGAGALIQIQEGGSAQFIGIDSKGVPEQRTAITEDRRTAASQGARLLENTGSQAESGEALRVRVSAKTTTLNTIAHTGAAGLEDTLKQIAVWIGANPDEVRVTPNTDFIEDNGNADEAMKLISARLAGLPISMESIHQWLQKNELTTKTWDEEIAMARSEGDLLDLFRVAPEPVETEEDEEMDDEETDDESDDDESDEDEETPDDE